MGPESRPGTSPGQEVVEPKLLGVEQMLSFDRIHETHVGPFRDPHSRPGERKALRDKFHSASSIAEAIDVYRELENAFMTDRRQFMIKKEPAEVYEPIYNEYIVCATSNLVDKEIVLENLDNQTLAFEDIRYKNPDIDQKDFEHGLKTARIASEWGLRLYELEASIALYEQQERELSSEDKDVVTSMMEQLRLLIKTFNDDSLSFLPNEKIEKIRTYRRFMHERLVDAEQEIASDQKRSALENLEQAAEMLATIACTVDTFVSYRHEKDVTGLAERIIAYNTQKHTV